MALSGKVGAVYTSDISIPLIVFTDAATTASVDRKRYQVTNTLHRYWDLDATITVKKNGSIISTGFSLERAGGFVVFENALLESDVVLVSGEAITLEQAGGFFNWSVEPDSETVESSTFESAGWTEYEHLLNSWSGSAEAFWGDESFFNMLGSIIVVVLFIDSGTSKRCVEGFAMIKSEGIEAPVNGLVEETIEYIGAGPLYLRL